MTENTGQFQPGEPRHPDAGRRAGTPNKSTARVRAAMANTSEQFIPLLGDYMARLSKTDLQECGGMRNHQAMMQVLAFLCDRTGVHIPTTPNTGEEGEGI